MTLPSTLHSNQMKRDRQAGILVSSMATVPRPITTASRAESQLNAILSDVPKATAVVSQESVAAARSAAAVTTTTSNRTAVRVLFLTTDTNILTDAVTSLDGYVALADIFDEVHVVVLRVGRMTDGPVLRIAPNGWVYTITARSWFRLLLAGIKFITNQFVFAEGFRPDIIVARDIGVSGLLATWLGNEYDRPVQIHVTTYAYRAFVNRESGRVLSYIGNRVLKSIASLRTDTQELADVVGKRFPHITDIAPLPRIQPQAYVSHATSRTILKERYPQFSFFIVYVGELIATSNCYKAIDAVRGVLRNPRVCLIMVGDGPARAECMKRATLLGIADQIIFERDSNYRSAYIAGADMVVVTDTTSFADDVIMEAAHRAIPMVIIETPLRRDLFGDTGAAVVVSSNDTLKLEESIRHLLSDNTERLKMQMVLPTLVAERLHIDPSVYREAYKESIERVLIRE